MPWIASSPPVPRIAAPRIWCVSASAIAVMKPCVSPFSMARPTRVIGTAADEERTAGRTRLRLSNADAAERRIDVESVGRNAIVHPPPLAIQEVRGDDLEIVIGGMSEGAATVAVTQRPDVRR